MLPPPYLWRVDDDRAFLDYRYGNVASVQQVRGQWRLSIRYQGITVMAPCASLRQGMRYADRWILARGAEIPGLGTRVSWYDRPRR